MKVRIITLMTLTIEISLICVVVFEIIDFCNVMCIFDIVVC